MADSARWVLVRGVAAQSVEHTESRRSGPRGWLRAVRWLVGAGLHPHANANTLKLAEDLAARMDFSTGQARYCLEETAQRLGVSVATTKRHAAYLRELGALVWVVHGSSTNIRRALGLDGYAGTATVYGAVIPPVYDHAMGHTIIGSGYEARIVIDQRDQDTPNLPQTGSDEASAPVDNSPAVKGLEPPSLTVVKEVGQVQMVGGFNNTSRKRTSRRTTPALNSTTKTENLSSNGGAPRRRSARQVARGIAITRRVRAMVNWTQTARLRRLEYVLRPLLDQGLDAHDIAAELYSWMLTWRPADPASYIHTRLNQSAAAHAVPGTDAGEQAPVVADPMDNAAWRAMVEQAAANVASLEALFGPEEPAAAVRTDVDRKLARYAGWHDFGMVAAHTEDDFDDAVDLYGIGLVSRAIGVAGNRRIKLGTHT
ncbi:cell wall protein [Streptomyces sp. N35]|uniref:cell wall protein n=1 Tax=Streptomyces sp. N35 TaxID=2795730 RepID=UPI0018F758F4|nr:cell wall protein [Streptomyces sp. N35]